MHLPCRIDVPCRRIQTFTTEYSTTWATSLPGLEKLIGVAPSRKTSGRATCGGGWNRLVRQPRSQIIHVGATKHLQWSRTRWPNWQSTRFPFWRSGVRFPVSRVKQMTYNIWYLQPPLALGIIRIGLGLIGSVSRGNMTGWDIKSSCWRPGLPMGYLYKLAMIAHCQKSVFILI